MKTIILILFLFSAVCVLGQVDEDCLCTPLPYTTTNYNADAIDTCVMKEIFDLNFSGIKECDDIPLFYQGYLTDYTFKHGFVYTKRGLRIEVNKTIVDNMDISNGDYFSINDIDDSYNEIKVSLLKIQDSLGLYRMNLYFELKDATLIDLEFENYHSYRRVIDLIENNLSPIVSVSAIRSFDFPQSGIENENNKYNFELKGNTLISEREIIESVTAYDLYGREIQRFESINSNSLNLSGLKGAYILQVKTNNTIHTIKYFNN